MGAGRRKGLMGSLLSNSPPEPLRKLSHLLTKPGCSCRIIFIGACDLFGFTTLKLHRKLGRDIVSKRDEQSHCGCGDWLAAAGRLEQLGPWQVQTEVQQR